MASERITPLLLSSLAEPFPSDEIQWRVGSTTKDKKRGMALAYIDARTVMDRLDKVCGGFWEDYYSEVAGRLVCSISVYGQTRSDGAGDTDFEAEKGGLSDAFKRAGVKWGIGRYLYRLPSEWVALDGRQKITTPPSLPHWALPSGEISDLDIDFPAVEKEDQTLQQTDIDAAKREIIGVILDLEAALINADQMTAEQRTQVRRKYADAIKLEAATVENLQAYHDNLVKFREETQ